MNLSTFNFSKLPKSFLLAAIIIFSSELISLLLSSNFHLVTSFASVDMEIKNRLSRDDKNYFDVLILGDCFNLTGINPKIIEEKTGLTCFNFSTYFNSTIFSQYCFLKNYLKVTLRRPKFIVIGFKPMSLACSKEQIETRLIHYFYYFKEGNLDIFLKEFGFGHSVKFFIPSLKFQSFFKNFIHNPLSMATQMLDNKKINEYTKDLIYVNKGFIEEDSFYGGDLKELGGVHENFTVTPFFFKYLNEILKIARQNNLSIIYLIPTAPPAIYQVDKKNGIADKYIKFIYSLNKNYDDFTIIHPQEILNFNDLYSGITHLNGKGARILSEVLSDTINKKKVFNNNSPSPFNR